MQIAILGPLEVRGADDAAIEIAGARLRTLLARLAVDAGRPVATSILVDAVWGERPPAEATNALQTLVSRLRRALKDTGAIVQSGAGYRLAADPDAVDAIRFERLVADAAAARVRDDRATAEHALTEALALWRGPALGDVRHDANGLAAYATRLEDLRLAVTVERAEIQDQPDLAQLEALAVEHPLNERLAARLMRVLALAGRSADALRVYERLRAGLAEELGADPDPEVRDLHLALLRGDVGPPKPPAAKRSNLKAQLTSFFGRDDEVARIGKSLEQHRLVTLVGPGGAGKTRLASEAAGVVVDSVADGVWLVELAPVTSGADVAPAVLSSLGLRDARLLERTGNVSVRDAMTRLSEGLAERQLLLVLDNCEHLIEACAHLADSLLGACPGLRVLATSREPLGILGEALLTVPPLGQPESTASAAEALEYPAVQLFADRAAAAYPTLNIDDSSVALVIEIVRRLDGLPLAIELAAARLRTLPLADIASRLSDRFRLLTGGSRTALPRHRTLRAVVEWSWDLLADPERRLAEQLSVFPSGVTVSSAAAISELSEPDVADLLASLVDKSLLQPVGEGHRLRMLETIREYGVERLDELGELADVRYRHAEHFAGVLAEAQPHLTCADQLPWFALLAAEQENILAAMRYRAGLGDADGALGLAVGLSIHSMMMGNNAEIPGWISESLAVPGGTDSALRIVAESLSALNLVAAGPSNPVNDNHRPELSELARAMGEIDAASSPFVALLRPVVAFFAHEIDLVKRYTDDAMASSDPWARAVVRMLNAALGENEGDVAAMRRHTEQALVEFRELGERWGLASTLRTLAQLRTLDGDLDGAEEALLEAMSTTRELGSRDDEGFVLGRLADLSLRRGDVDTARRYLNQAREQAAGAGAPIESIFGLTMLAGIEQAAGNLDEAQALQQQALDRVALMASNHPAFGHVNALVSIVSAALAVEEGALDRARELARTAYTAALGTHDLPIVASVGVMLARVVAAGGEPMEAATLLGAAARLRGADDLTAREIVMLTATLREALGDTGFETRYAEGKELDREAAQRRLDPSV